MAIKTAEQWADAVESLMGSPKHYDHDTYSLAYSSGEIAGIRLDLEADDDQGRRFTAANGWVIRYDERSTFWYSAR